MLAAVGLALAIIDFTGLTRAVETLLDAARLRLQEVAEWLWRNLVVRFARSLNEWDIDKASILLKVAVLGLYTSALYLFGRFFIEIVLQVPEAWSQGYGAVLILLAMIIYVGALMLPGVLIAAWLAAYLLWGLFHILNMPRKGIVGSIALLVAVADYYYRG